MLSQLVHHAAVHPTLLRTPLLLLTSDGILVSPEPLELPDAQQLEELRRSYGII